MQKFVKMVVVLVLCWGLGGLSGLEAMAAVDGQVNINTAGGQELEKLPFIGEARAQAIVRYRQTKGRFGSVDELRQVPGIGDDTFQSIKPYLTLSGASTFSGAKADPPAAGQAKSLPPIMTQTGEIRLLTDQAYYPTLQSMIGHATGSIDIAMFLFKTTDASSNRAAGLVQDLIAARRRGVAISILLEKSGYDQKINIENQKVASRLQKEGVRVRFDSEKITTHTKIVVIDHRYCLLGSHNFTGSALAFNHEASLLVDSQPLANQLLEYMSGIR